MLVELELMTPNASLGTVLADGTADPRIAGFLEQIVLPGGVQPGDDGYLEALYGLLRGGSALWAQPLA